MALKPIQCLAAICWAPNKPMTIETVTVAAPKAGEVRIKMVSAGICASDLTFYTGNFAPVKYPAIFGHEGNGIVESVGEGVTDFKIGDAVFPLWNPECKDCKLCKSANCNICEKSQIFSEGLMMDGTSRISKDGQLIYVQSITGTFSEYSTLYDFCLAKVPDGLPLEKLSPFGCCVLTGYGAAINTANVHPGATVAIWGLGAVGLCVALGCKHAGATKIIGVDINAKKFDIGRKFGCTDFVNPLEVKSVVQAIQDLTDGGADFTFVAVGKAEAAEAALEACHKSYGKSVLLGMITGDGIISGNPLNLLYGKTWTGTNCGGYRVKTALPKLLSSYMKGEMPETDLLITNVIKLNQINEGFQDLIAGKQIRTAIVY